MKKLVLWGPGGHATVVLDTARSAAAFHSIAFVHEKAGQHGSQMCGCPVFASGRPEVVLVESCRLVCEEVGMAVGHRLAGNASRTAR